MERPSKETIAIAALRIALAVMYLGHAIILKIITLGFEGTSKAFVGLGFPWWVSYPVIFVEVFGGTLLLFGLFTRVISLALTPILIGALIVKFPNGWLFDYPGGGWEYLAYLILLSFAQVALGPGAFALDNCRPRQS
jgi:putative oxidoreductase